MSRTWQLRDVELVVLWEKLAAEPLPPPLIFTSNTRKAEDFRREKKRIWDRYSDLGDGAALEALRVVNHPDVRIVVHGSDPRNPEDPRTPIRMLAALRGPRAVLITQLPGETVWHSGGYVVADRQAEGLADTIVAALPECAPGRLADVVLVEPTVGDEDVDHWYGRSNVRDFADEVERRAEEFNSAPLSFVGGIEIGQGHSVFGPRGITQHSVLWRDRIDDGRYAIVDMGQRTAIGVDARRLSAMVNSAIGQVLTTLADEPTD